jgi:hypothetical protein
MNTSQISDMVCVPHVRVCRWYRKAVKAGKVKSPPARLLPSEVFAILRIGGYARIAEILAENTFLSIRLRRYRAVPATVLDALESEHRERIIELIKHIEEWEVKQSEHRDVGSDRGAHGTHCAD